MDEVWAVYKGELPDLGETVEVESIWSTEYGADKRAADLNGDGDAVYSSMGWRVRHREEAK